MACMHVTCAGRRGGADFWLPLWKDWERHMWSVLPVVLLCMLHFWCFSCASRLSKCCGITCCP
jgi:hypothetical protein